MPAPRWSRQGSGRRRAPASTERPGGLRLAVDPSLSTRERAIRNVQGKREGTVKQFGAKWSHSGDEFKSTHASADAALRAFVESKE